MPSSKKSVSSKSKSSSSDSDFKKLKSKETYEFTWHAEITPFYANLDLDLNEDDKESQSLCKLSSSKFLAGLSAGSLSEWHLSLVLNHQSRQIDLILVLDRIFNNSTTADPNFKSSKSKSTDTTTTITDKNKVKIQFGLQAKILNLRRKPIKNAGFPDLILGSSKEIPEENHFKLTNFISWKSLVQPKNKLIKISKDQSQKYIKIQVKLDFYGLVIENKNSNLAAADLSLEEVQQNQSFADQQFKQVQDFDHNNTWTANFLKEELDKPADIYIRSSEGKVFPAHLAILKVRAPLFALQIKKKMKRNWSSENGPSQDQDEVSAKLPLKTHKSHNHHENVNPEPVDVDMDNKSLDSFLQIVYQTSSGGQENTQQVKFKIKDERKSTSSPSPSSLSPSSLNLNSIEGPSGVNLMKIACINQMVRKISVENAALILHLFRYGHNFEPYNMEIIGNFCFDNSDEIMRSQAFKDHFGNDQKAFSNLYLSLLTEEQVHKKLDEELSRLDLT